MRFIDCSTGEPVADTWQKAGDYAALLIGVEIEKEIQIQDTKKGNYYPFTVYRKSQNPAFGIVGTPYKTKQVIYEN